MFVSTSIWHMSHTKTSRRFIAIVVVQFFVFSARHVCAYFIHLKLNCHFVKKQSVLCLSYSRMFVCSTDEKAMNLARYANNILWTVCTDDFIYLHATDGHVLRYLIRQCKWTFIHRLMKIKFDYIKMVRQIECEHLL